MCWKPPPPLLHLQHPAISLIRIHPSDSEQGLWELQGSWSLPSVAEEKRHWPWILPYDGRNPLLAPL